MTAFMSAVFDGNRIEILSDGASYLPDGQVSGFGTKVSPIPGFHAAQMTRGEVETGDRLKALVEVIFAQARSFDRAIELLRILACGDIRAAWDIPVQCAIWGISETRGPETYWFATADVHKGDGRWKLMSTGQDFWQGESCEWPAQYKASGTLADKGVYLMQNLRQVKNSDLMTGYADLDGGHPIVGGHVDLTTITLDGVTQRRLHTWPDRIGERMVWDPSTVDIPSRIAAQAGLAVIAKAYAASKAAATVAPVKAEPPLSRQQRRALSAAERKKAA